VLALALTVVVAYTTIGLLSSSSEKGSFDRYSNISNPGKAATTAYEYRQGTLANVPKYMVQIPLGAGIGSKGPAASVAGGTEVKGLNGESEPTFLLIELGLPGFVVMLGLNLMLFYLSITRIRKIDDRETRILLTAIAAPLFAIFATWFVGISTATTPNAPYLWFAAGVLSFWLLGRGRELQAPRPPDSAAITPAWQA
jgi:hypothetical protein